MDGIVFLTVDCLRSDHIGCYGYNRPTTPNIDSLAESGTLYEHSYANCPGTRWAFQSLHTGVSSARIDGLGIPDGYEPLATKLSKRGYKTGWFGINGFVSTEYNYDRGFDSFYGVEKATSERGTLYRIGKQIYETVNSDSLNRYVLRPAYNWLDRTNQSNSGEYRPPNPDKKTVDNALSFVNSRLDGGDDFFCWVHFMDAHTPYGRYPDHLQAIRGDTEVEHVIHPGQDGKVVKDEEPPESVIDTYDACIRNVDEQVGRLLNQLPEDTMVVFTGDHGEEFGRYGGFHSASMYSSLTQVPIIIRDPELTKGRKKSPVQHLDLPPTILRRAGISIPNHWEGRPLQETNRDYDDPIYFGFSNTRGAVRVGDWKYLDNGDDEPALYHTHHSGTDDDPVTEQYPEKANKLRRLLDEYRSRPAIGKGKSDINNDDSEISDTIEENLEDLGYL